MSSVLVVGSVALDTLETPYGKSEDCLGGSATHFSLAASRFAPVKLVAVVGKDFPSRHVEMLRGRGVDTGGLETADGLTFRWHGRFQGDMSRAETVSVALNVLATFQPKVPAAFASTPYVLLGNSSPDVQKATLAQLKNPAFVMLDTMNLWIDSAKPALLDLLPRVHALCVNHEEAQQLAGAKNTAAAIRGLLDLGTRIVIVKRGEHGSTLATRDFQFSIPAYPTEKFVDPTGAGDSFAGGILGYLARSGGDATSLRKALIYGSVMGSFTVEEFGTGRLQRVTPEEVETRAKALMEMIRV
ncbi:MAG TPA: PfkB family carbohydrate kinase [Planctomycetota bacterium]